MAPYDSGRHLPGGAGSGRDTRATTPDPMIHEMVTVRQRARAFAALLHDELIDLARDDAGAVPLVALARAVYDALDTIGGVA